VFSFINLRIVWPTLSNFEESSDRAIYVMKYANYMIQATERSDVSII